jgi:hypothetical protein
MGQIQHRLWQVCRLHNTPNLYRPLCFNELPDGVEQFRRELGDRLVFV